MCQFKHTPDFDTQRLTLMFWLRLNTKGYHWMISRGEWTEGYSIGVLSQNEGRATGGKIRACLDISGTNNDYIFSTTSLQAHAWYHVALVYDGSHGRLYVNGNCETIREFPPDSCIRYNKYDLFVGGEALGLGQKYKSYKPRHFLNGCMKDCRVIGKALSADAISRSAKKHPKSNARMLQELDQQQSA